MATMPPTLAAITPALGSVEGGTHVTIAGTGFVDGATVTIGGIACTSVWVTSPTELACTTGSSHFVEGAKDVVVTNSDGGTAILAAAFTYECPWTTSAGRRSCGAVPPRPPFAAQPIAAYVTQFQASHGFIASGAARPGDNLNDTADHVLGTQSAVIETDGAGTARTLTRLGLPPIDFTNHAAKLWVKLDNVAHAANLSLALGSGNLANRFSFAFHSTQGQKWTTEGDWVAFTMTWSPDSVSTVGTPNRAAITDIQLRVVDDASGTPVRLHVNGLALVAEPLATYPNGVVSITFDDNFATMVSAGLPVLAQQNMPATAYVITDLVDDPGRATLADLTALQNTHGWEIAAHAAADVHHAARYPNLTAQVVEDDMVDTRAWLIANGFAGYDHCAYPGGDFTGGLGTDVLALARRYFATCRTIYQRQRETYLPADSAKLRVLYVQNTTTLARAMAAVDSARANREWIILVFHSLVATPSVSTEWSATDFATLVDHIATSGMPVKTVGQVRGN
jgi:peptidoglycan/xylan/chitin deacetylase (PgdA/CDA1 family)